MTDEEYQALIPIFCPYRTTQQHIDYMAGCWSISSGRMKARGSEGPQYCHLCDISIKSSRFQDFILRKLRGGDIGRWDSDRGY